MNDETKERVSGVLPVFYRFPPDVAAFYRQVLQIILAVIRPPPDPLLDIRHRICDGQIETWDGKDVFTAFSSHRYSFYLATRETPESLLNLARCTNNAFPNDVGPNYRLSHVNRVMLYMMWLRSYPSYHNLSLIFNVSVATIYNEIHRCIPIFSRTLEHFIQWPTVNAWRDKRGTWPKLNDAVGQLTGHLPKYIAR
ncbi:unnamed protein product [Mytilus edulis]|uniref:Transposase Helix-turn-helix domain-containing protein n=1 Tax=Mytilus edulis TaxID=6550 RepID=A0A8S3UVU7_MYTED|nr:unnamed protein product [Mytilus edulis]